jgi:hypothetical protein
LVDYPWVLTAVVVVMLSVLKIQSEAKNRDLAMIDRSRVIAQRTLKNLEDWQHTCMENGVAESIENAIGAIPQNTFPMEYQNIKNASFNPCTSMLELRVISRDVRREWSSNFPVERVREEVSVLDLWRDFCRTVDVLAIPGVPYDNTFGDICDDALTLREGLLSHIYLKDMIDAGISSRWVTEEPWQLRWWYFLLAFFVGLRLAKVTAEIKKDRAQQKAHITQIQKEYGSAEPIQLGASGGMIRTFLLWCLVSALFFIIKSNGGSRGAPQGQQVTKLGSQ